MHARQIAANWTPRGICCLHSRRILELDTRGIRTRIARTFTFSKRAHVCVRAGGVCARRALPTQVPLSLRNRAKRSPHARTRWRKHPCKKRGPVLAWSLLLGDNGVFTHGKDRCRPATMFQIFCTAKSSEALQKVAKMPENTRKFSVLKIPFDVKQTTK